MAKLPRNDEAMLTSSTAFRDAVAAGDVNMDPDDGGGGSGGSSSSAAAVVAAATSADVSLEEILTLYNQPINEEQAWAVCYQCCRTLAQKQRRRGLKSAAHLCGDPKRIEGPGDVLIGRDGTVKLQPVEDAGKSADRSARVWPQLRVNAVARGPASRTEAMLLSPSVF